jgi:hypothetical protein
MGRKKDEINSGCLTVIFIGAVVVGISQASVEAFVVALIAGIVLGIWTRVLR